MRRKKKNKVKKEQLKLNMIERMKIMCVCVKQTFNYYKKHYFENDYYRQNKLLEIQHEELEVRKAKKQAKKKT